MKISNDYEIRVEQKYYAIFKDVNGIEQKVEVEKEVADALAKAQRDENNQSRYARKYTVSLDSMDYEGEAFASYDDYQKDKEPPLDEKVKMVLKQMKPKQARLLYEIVFMNNTQEKRCRRRLFRSVLRCAKRISKKLLKNFFRKPYIRPLFNPNSEGT